MVIPEHAFEPQEMSLFQTCFEEGYDLEDERYESWLRIYHPEAGGNHEDECTVECSPSETLQNTATPISVNLMPRSSLLC